MICAAGFLLASVGMGASGQEINGSARAAGAYGLSQEDVCGMEAAPVEEVRVLLPNEWGVPYPVGLSYSLSRNQLILMDRPQAEADGSTARLVVITPYEEPVGVVDVSFSLNNPINIATDDAGSELLLLDEVRMEIARVQVGEDGVSPVKGPIVVDVRHLGLLQAGGMAVEAESRRLFILDSEALQIVSVDIEQDFGLISRIDLRHLAGETLRGIAVHPDSGHFFVAGVTEQVMYELTEAGRVVHCYDLGGLDLVDLQGMGFGPSADLTDSPDTIHLFIADSNLGEKADGDRGDGNQREANQSVFGSIKEVAITPQCSDDCSGDAHYWVERCSATPAPDGGGKGRGVK